MDYVKNTATVRERQRRNDSRRMSVALSDEELLYNDSPSRGVTIERLVAQATAGYMVFPKHVFDYKDLPSASHTFGYKRGPFWDLLAKNDLREVSHRLLRDKPPIFAVYAGTVLFSPIVGIRFGLVNSTKYAVSLADLISSQIAYEDLRKTGKIISKDEGSIRVGYDHGIIVSIQQLVAGASGFINAQASGIPSRRDLERASSRIRTHSPHFALEVIPDARMPRGYFVARSGGSAWRVANTVPYKMWPASNDEGLNPIISDSPETSPGSAMRRDALYFADLLALRLVDGIARRQYDVRVNHPLPRFSIAAKSLALSLGSKALIRSGSRVRRPSAGELEQILFSLHSLWQNKEVPATVTG